MANARLFLIVAICGIIFASITYLSARYFKSKIIKYIPCAFAASVSVFFLVRALYFSKGNGFEDIAFIIMALIAFGVFIVSLITALFIEFWRRK